MTTPDFQTQLRLQLRDAARREERRGGLSRTASRLPRLSPALALAAVALVALAVALGGLSLRGTGPATREPAKGDVTRFSVSPTLGPIVNAFGAVWAVDPNGRLLRIDPVSHDVLGALDVAPRTNLGAAAGTLWVNDPVTQTAIRIDPRTGEVVARIPMRLPNGDQFVAGDVEFGDRLAWAAGVEGLLKLDLQRNVVDGLVPINTAGLVRGMVLDDRALWVLARNDRLLRLDPRTGARRGSIAVSWQPTAGLDSEQGVPIEWSPLTGHFARVDLASGKELWHQELGHVNWWTVAGPDIWVHVSDGSPHDRLVRLDARTGRKLGTVQLLDLGVTGLTVVKRQVWVATPGGQIDVVKIPPR
jgi:hypothetical protein